MVTKATNYPINYLKYNKFTISKLLLSSCCVQYNNQKDLVRIL